jgi:hypothetical protein
LTCPDTIFESDSFDLIEHDGFGGGEGEVVLEDPQVAVSDFNGVVFVENL